MTYKKQAGHNEIMSIDISLEIEIITSSVFPKGFHALLSITHISTLKKPSLLFYSIHPNAVHSFNVAKPFL